MDQLEQITNEPIEMELAGKKYKLRAYSLVDLATLRQKLKSDRIDLIQEKITDKDIQFKLLSEALREKITDEEIQTHIVETVDGMAFILHCMLKEDQDITFKQAMEIIQKDGVTKVISVIMSVNQPKEVKKKVKKANQ